MLRPLLSSRLFPHSSQSDPVQIKSGHVTPLLGTLHVCSSFLSEEKPVTLRCSVKPYRMHVQLQQPSHLLTPLQDTHLLADAQMCQANTLDLRTLTLAAPSIWKTLPRLICPVCSLTTSFIFSQVYFFWPP